MLDGPYVELRSYLLFMIRAGVGRIPALFRPWRLPRWQL
jgi:hypothetical protein